MSEYDKSQRQDSAFYQADDDPQNVWDGNNRFYVERVGIMRITYTDPEGRNNYLSTTEDLESIGIHTDADLAEYTKKGYEVFEWVNNSWFEIWDAQDSEYLGEVYHELDEAVERAQHLYQISIGEEN